MIKTSFVDAEKALTRILRRKKLEENSRNLKHFPLNISTVFVSQYRSETSLRGKIISVNLLLKTFLLL